MHLALPNQLPIQTDSEFLYRTLLPPNVGGRLGIYELVITHPNPHAHAAENQIYIVQSGKGIMQIDREEATVGPGHLVFIPRGAVHSLTPEGDEPVVVYSIIEQLE